MRILGIDPGLRTTGFGVIEHLQGQMRYIASGTIQTLPEGRASTAAAKGDLPARLKILFDGIREVTARYQPTCAAVEIVFINVNPQASLLLGQARGACLTALVSCGPAWAGCGGRTGSGHHPRHCRAHTVSLGRPSLPRTQSQRHVSRRTHTLEAACQHG